MNSLVQYNPFARLFNKLAEDEKSLFSKFSNYLAYLFVKDPPKKAEKLLTAIGVAAITIYAIEKLYRLYCLFHWVPKHFKNRRMFSPRNLRARYG